MELAAEGVANLIKNCAEIQMGEEVFLINEIGAMEPELVDMIAEAVKKEGASCHILWAEKPDGDGTSLSPVVAGAIKSADKVIAHYDLKDSVLGKLLDRAGGLRVVHSMFRKVEDFASIHGRFHWGMANAIYHRFEKEVFRQGRKWRITTPVGTEIFGTIGHASERARQVEDERAPFSRSFNSPAFVPVSIVGSEGRAVIEYAGGPQRIAIDHPPTIVLENNVMVKVEGPKEAKKWIDQYGKVLDDREQRLGTAGRTVDSWHGGLHPRADCVRGLVGNASTKMLHFHMAPDGAHTATQMGDLDLELDGEKIFQGGKYAPGFDDAKLREAARSFGLEHWK